MTILEKLPDQEPVRSHDEEVQNKINPQMNVATMDGKAELQSLDKPQWIQNCSKLAEHFTEKDDQKIQ